MEVTEEMMVAAMKKAVEVGLVPKVMEGDAYIKAWNGMKQCLETAAEVAPRPMATMHLKGRCD